MSVTLAGPRVENLGPPEPFEPVKQGPVWQETEDGYWLLPRHTLGWAVIDWCAENLNSATGDPGGWRFTDEQARFILWFYAIDEAGQWAYRDAVIQKVKGWGKDPLAAVISAVELLGPCRFGGWDEAGEALAVPQREPWIQILAVTKEQTKTTMVSLQGLFPKATVAKYSMELNKGIIYAHGGSGRIEAISSGWRSNEGPRVSLVICNEPHHWVKSNDGHSAHSTARRNVNKMREPKGARLLYISNAYNPSEGSVMQEVREAYDENLAKGVVETLYDSLEAPETVALFPKYTRLDEGGNRIAEYDAAGNLVPPGREVFVEHLSQILRVLRGDAVWLSAKETALEILRPDADLSEMRRFYLNSVVSGDDVYVADGDLVATIHETMAALRPTSRDEDILRLGWTLVGPDEPIAMFFDGSKSEDSTGIVGCRLSDGYIFTIGVWEQPPARRGGKAWLAPRDEVDARVREAFATFKVVAFWADPSHAKDDQAGTRYWDYLIDGWHQDFHEQLVLPAMVSGDRRSSVMWDMSDPAHQKTFSEAVVRFRDEMDLQTIRWDGHPTLRIHLRNTRAAWTPAGLSVRKPARGSARKIDLAVCAIGAWMLRRLVLNKGLDEKPAGRLLLPNSVRRGW